MKPDIEAIKARCEAATPGPWDHEHFKIWSMPSGVACIAEVFDGIEKWRGNGAFIAHSRTDIPVLLAYIVGLEAEVERLRSDLYNAKLVQELRIVVDEKSPAYELIMQSMNRHGGK